MWSESRKGEGADPHAAGDAVEEAERLGNEIGRVADLVQKAAASEGDGLAPEVASKQIWLPPKERDNVAMVQRLVELARLTGQDPTTSSGSTARVSPISYKFSAAIGQKGGWLGAAEGEVLAELEERVKQLSQAIGQPRAGKEEADDRGEPSLADTTLKLHKRLDSLQRVQDTPSCESLLATIRLLSAEVDVAIAEAKHLEALEAEDAADDSFAGEDDLPQQIGRLHEQVGSISAVFARVAELDRRLTIQEPKREQLERFSCDLAGAETQALHAADLLRGASEAAVQMKASVEATRKQLDRNVAVLEKRLAEWEAKPRSSPDNRNTTSTAASKA